MGIFLRPVIHGIVIAVVQTSRKLVTSLSNPDYCEECGEYLEECVCEESEI